MYGKRRNRHPTFLAVERLKIIVYDEHVVDVNLYVYDNHKFSKEMTRKEVFHTPDFTKLSLSKPK